MAQAGPSADGALAECAALGSVDQVRSCLEAGHQPDAPDVGGITPLYAACQNGHAQVAMLLLEAKASPDLTLGEGAVTPLLISCSLGNLDCINALVRRPPHILCAPPLCAHTTPREGLLASLSTSPSPQTSLP